MGLWLLRLFSCFVLMVVCLSIELGAQTTTSGGLTGVVTDETKAVVPDADVEIKDNAKGATQTTKTDRERVYRFFFLAPARYLLTVSHAGFRKETRVVNVLLGPPVTVNFKLEVHRHWRAQGDIHHTSLFSEVCMRNGQQVSGRC